MSDQKEESSEKREQWLLIILATRAFWGLFVFIVGLLIRLTGITWGLPNEQHHWSYHPDEPVIWAYSQQIKPAEGKFTPGFYNYGTLYLTTLKVATDIVNGYGGGPKKQDGSDSYQAMANYHLAGRIISALAGAGIGWICLLVLWRKTSWVGATFAGLAVAFAPGLVVHSRFQTVDVLATFFLACGLYFALKLLDPGEGASKWYQQSWLWTGVFLGLSAGTKYTGLLGLFCVAVICFQTKRWRDLALSVCVCFATFVISTPGILLDSSKFFKDFSYEMAHTSAGHGLVFAGTANGYIYHLTNLAIGYGTILTLIGIVGLVVAVIKKKTWALPLLAFFLAYFILIGRAEVKFLRYVFPLIPVLAIAGGWAVGQAHRSKNIRLKVGVVGGIMGLSGFLGGGLTFALQSCSTMSNPEQDPRQSVLKTIPEGSTVGLVSDPWFYTANFYPEAGSPRWAPIEARDQAMTGSKWNLVRIGSKGEPDRHDWDTRTLDAKPEYIAFSSFETEGLDRIYQRNTVPKEFEVQAKQYGEFIARLQSEYQLVGGTDFNPWVVVHDLMYIRPTIWVWKRKSNS